MNQMWDRVAVVAARIEPSDDYEAEVALRFARRAARSAIKDSPNLTLHGAGTEIGVFLHPEWEGETLVGWNVLKPLGFIKP